MVKLGGAEIYARLALTEEQFNAIRGAVVAQRQVVFKKWWKVAALDGIEKEFYSKRIDAYDALLAEKFDPVLIADTSQDAEPDEDEDET